VTPTVRLLAAAVTILAVTSAACSQNDPSVEPGATVAATMPTTTVVFTGTPAELLPEMAIDMSRLSAQVSEDGDGEDVTLARIVGLWAAAEPQVRDTHPELVASIQTTVEMATSAVRRKRPADADKAFALLTNLVDSYTGDG
jgi:hypothetical protein